MYKIGLIIILFLVGCSKDNGSNDPVAPTAPQIEAAEWRISSIEVGELDFGLVDFDKQKMLTINILNDGPVTLPSTPVISNSDFSLAFSSCNNLQPKDKCVIKVVFNAKDKEDGTYTANLVYGDAINTLTAQINRSGQVVESSFKSSGLFITDYNFGVIEYRHNLMKTILVVNSGTELMNSTIALTGSGFRKVYDKCSNVPLKPKQSCLVKVVLSGQGLTGAVSGQMTYADKSLSFTATVKTQKQLAQENSEFVFVYNNVNHSTMPIDLQTINLNEIKEYRFYVKNIGSASGQVNDFGLTSLFNVIFDNCQGQIIAPNKSCYMRAVLLPQSKGTFSTDISADVDYQINSQSVQWTVRSPGDKIECTNEIPNALLANINWNGSVYSNCLLEACVPNHHIDDNACIANTITCDVAHGSGTQIWNTSNNSYDQCIVSACDSNRYAIVNNTCDYIEPVAQNTSHNLLEDGSVLNQVLNYSTTNPATITIVSNVTHGVLTRTGSNYSYTPAPNYHGLDSFTYKVNDGEVDSNIATVSFTISPVNDVPVVLPQSLTVAEDNSLSITLSGSDIDNDTLTYIIVTPPTKGTLTQNGAQIVYTPAANYFGLDSFTFKANDGTADSAPATIAITVTPVNDAPVAQAQSLGIVEDTARSFTLTGTDVEGSNLSYTVTQLPATGVLSGTAPNLTYTPTYDFSGDVTIKFKVNDGTVDSPEAVVTFTRNLINQTYINERIAVLESKYRAKGHNITLPRVMQEPVTVANINAVSSVINNLNLTDTVSTLITGSTLSTTDVNAAFAKHTNIRLHCADINACYANKSVYNKAIYLTSILTVKNNLLWEAATSRYLGTQCTAWYSESEVSWADKKLDSSKTNVWNNVTYADNTTNNRYLTVLETTAPTCGTIYFSYYQGCRSYGYVYVTLGGATYPAANMGNGGCASGSGVATVTKGSYIHIGSHYYGSATLRSGY